MYQHIWEGERMTVNGRDINNDGRMDLVIGNLCGGAALYLADTVTGISESNSESFDFNIYPNPTSGKANVQSSQFENLKMKDIEIYNVYGEKIYSAADFHIDISFQPQGIYFCKVIQGNFSRTKKLILLK